MTDTQLSRLKRIPISAMKIWHAKEQLHEEIWHAKEQVNPENCKKIN